jgi:signal transduction histidine kinase
MRHCLKIVFFILFSFVLNAQQNGKDSLLMIINKHAGTTTEVDALVSLGHMYRARADSMFLYAEKGLSLARKINYKKGEGDCLWVISEAYYFQENYGEAIRSDLESLRVYQDINEITGVVEACMTLQGKYRDAGDYRKALLYAFMGEQKARANNIKGRFTFDNATHLAPLLLAEIAQIYVLMGQLDSAIFYTQKAIDEKELFRGTEWNFPIYLQATYQTMKGDYQSAIKNFRIAKILAAQNGFDRDTIQNMSGMSTLFIKTNQLDSALYYAKIVVRDWWNECERKCLIESNNNLAIIYKLSGNADSALKYTEITHALNDSIFSKEKDRELQRVAFRDELKQQEIIAEQAKYKSRVQFYTLSAGLLILVLLAAILWRNNRQKQKSRNKIEQAYNELKSTQAQLIQSEKMASLGELTAGIAHEIQNPLNFVNNFSDVNTELVDELQQEADKGNLDEVKAIAKDIKENEEKINHHGKRADAIVKNMLQHSRTSSGKKEPTDINALAEEYLRLSYHGLRAKDKSFNAITKTDFDNNIGKIDVIPQDIGRVILNLINNAFYAVSEKQKQNLSGYEPTVSVSTKRNNGKVEIKIADNGNGIPQKVLDKIFQPFFTTKPTGQGTGLGLSLSYDIVKAHGGEIKVETNENEGTQFIIQLPFS